MLRDQFLVKENKTDYCGCLTHQTSWSLSGITALWAISKAGSTPVPQLSCRVENSCGLTRAELKTPRPQAVGWGVGDQPGNPLRSQMKLKESGNPNPEAQSNEKLWGASEKGQYDNVSSGLVSTGHT